MRDVERELEQALDEEMGLEQGLGLERVWEAGKGWAPELELV